MKLTYYTNLMRRHTTGVFRPRVGNNKRISFTDYLDGPIPLLPTEEYGGWDANEGAAVANVVVSRSAEGYVKFTTPATDTAALFIRRPAP